MAWQEKDLIGRPALRDEALDDRGFELRGKTEHISRDENELPVATAQE